MSTSARAFGTSLFALPAAFFTGVGWMLAALPFFESRTGRHRPDLIGTNHTPNYDFIYYPGGRGIEFWSLEAPLLAFAVIALVLIVWCFVQRKTLGWRRVSGIVCFSLLFGILLVAASVFFYFTAVSIFI